jgi:hypothetical protein
MIQRSINVHGGVSGNARRPAPSPNAPWLPEFALACAVLSCVAAAVVWQIRPALLIEAPAPALLFVALGVVVTLACAGQWLIHKHFPERDFVQHNEVGGFIIAVSGTLYAVILGFLTVVAWEHFSDARQLVASESAAATDVWHITMGLPQVERNRVRRDILTYSKQMVSNEWPQMRGGDYYIKADFVVMDAMSTVGTFKPTNFMQSNSQSATQEQLSALHDVRQRRLAENASGISGFEWLVLLLGAACILSFCWLFGVANRRVHLFMTATVAVIITSTLVLLFELQYPFRTDLRIQPERWNATINHIQLMQRGYYGLKTMRM